MTQAKKLYNLYKKPSRAIPVLFHADDNGLSSEVESWGKRYKFEDGSCLEVRGNEIEVR